MEQITPEIAYQKIKEWIGKSDLISTVYYDDYDWSDFPDLKIANDDVLEVYSYNEGDGNECGKVFFIEKYNLYFKVSGWYSSWDSGEITDISRVYPHSKYRIEYEGTPQTLDSLKDEYEKFNAHWQSSNKA